MLNVSPLNSIYGNDIPADLQDALKFLEQHLQKQKKHVQEVTILPNCSIDHDRTIHLQQTVSKDIKFVLQGVIVTLSPEYRLSYADAVWFHPEMAKGRSVYNLKTSITKEDLNKVREIHHVDGKYDKDEPAMMSPFHCDVGHYTSTEVDDMGLSSTNNRLIVNVSLEALTYPLWRQYLLTNELVGKVYENWTSMDMGNGKSIMDTSAHVRNEIVCKITNQTMHDTIKTQIYSDQVNALYSDGANVYFTNHAVKTPKDVENVNVLLHNSALSGYEMYNTKTEELFVPSNIGLSSKTFNWNDMSEQQRKRIFEDCTWEGDEGFNTYVLKPPALVSVKKKSFEQKYGLFNGYKLRMKIAKFSSQPVRDFIEIGKLLKLTPLEAPATHSRHGDNIELKMSLEYQPFSTLMNKFEKISKEHPEFQLFNTDLVSNGYIKIPREIIKKLI
jgi:hypothetical protein